MGKYSCKCPAPGCVKVFETVAGSWKEAFKKIYTEGNRHLIDCHPDFPESDDRKREARAYAKTELKRVDLGTE